MNTFLGIIDRRGKVHPNANHAVCLKRNRAAFPSYFKTSEELRFGSGTFIGDWQHAPSTDSRSEILLCGEIHNLPDIANEIGLSGKPISPALTIQALIAEKGLDGIQKLNGRFVILAHDQAEKKLHIINDQMGIQQVIIHQTHDFLLIGSEIKFLLKHPECPCEIDWHNALKRPIPFIVMDGEENYNAWFKGINLMTEGSVMSINLMDGEISHRRYWDGYAEAQKQMDSGKRTVQSVMDEYMELLCDAVKIRVQDDGAAQSFLSGGLDSSIISAMARKCKPTDTYSIATQVTLLEGTTEMVNRLSNDLNLENSQFVIPFHKLTFDPGLWKERIWRAESPYNHTDSLTKTLLHYAMKRFGFDPNYVLTGTGSDQLNGGLARWIAPDVENAEENWNMMAANIRDEEIKRMIPLRFYSMWGARNYLSTEFINSQNEHKLEENPWTFYIKTNLHLNHFCLMWDENRAGTSYGRSVRYPFLDHRFVPFMAAIPVELHKDLFYDKQILREPSKKWLPDYIINKPKAPAATGVYDNRIDVYSALLETNNGALLDDMMDGLDNAHPAISKEGILKEIHFLKANPSIIRWEYLFNVLNLRLLEKLRDQDESSMHYESRLDGQIELITDYNEATRISLYQKLELPTDDQIIDMRVRFADGCSLMQNHFSKTLYLMKNDALSYEIDPVHETWVYFLTHIDGTSTTKDILQKKGFTFDEIKEFFSLCLKEEILSIDLNQ